MIEYLVIGGYAVALYGYPRATVFIPIHRFAKIGMLLKPFTVSDPSYDIQNLKRRSPTVAFPGIMSCTTRANGA